MRSLITIGIDASWNRSGGAKANLIGILSKCDPAVGGVVPMKLFHLL